MKEMELSNFTAKTNEQKDIELMLNNCVIIYRDEELMLNTAEEITDIPRIMLDNER